jgi:threonylcarbamoyladenosine tRNA methylthiotransferase MtaB
MEHFGCRAARADGEAVGHRLRTDGLCERRPSTADVVVVNTCSVTAEADRAALAFIRRAHRLNPAARIVVTGCFAQRAPEELAGLEGVSAVVGNSHKALAPEIILGLLGPAAPLADGGLVQIQAATNLERAMSEQLATPQVAQVVWADQQFLRSFLEEAQIAPGVRTRPNLKIQEGCANRCAFCVIPQTRGPSRSLPHAVVLRQVEGFVAAGGNELVLSGINLGRWGRDFSASAQQWPARDAYSPSPSAEEQNAGSSASARFAQQNRASSLNEPTSFGGAFRPSPAPRTLAGLAREIFAQTALPRLRLSSIEPMDWDAEMIGLMAEFGGTRLARHAHLPLQSGSDAVLRRMHRRYRPWHYAEKVAALVRAAGPALTLGADVMVGFPGETDAEFEETLALVRALPFGYLHLFPFSPRPGTPGWALYAERPVPAEAIEERMALLRALAAEKSETHRRGFVGRELEAITLRTPAGLRARGRSNALTENFLPMEIEGRWEANRLLRLHVSRLTADGALEAAAVGLEPVAASGQ